MSGAKVIENKQIIFFVAKQLGRPIGIYSVIPCFSTFACRNCGVFDDFFVEPAFRRQGIARLLTRAAQNWCGEQNYASLTVGCADCDTAMYRSLGFDVKFGTMLASEL